MAVVGAPGTGRHWLAAELKAQLRSQGVPATVTVANEAAGLICDVTLLAGLDWPLPPACTPQEAAAREAQDHVLRSALAQDGVPFRVVYGRGAQRVANAVAAVDAASAPPVPGNDRAWSCDKCSDPDCEHRLFTRLL